MKTFRWCGRTMAMMAFLVICSAEAATYWTKSGWSDVADGEFVTDALANGGTAKLTFKAQGRAVLGFDWAVSGARGADVLSVAVDGRTVDSISGSVDYAGKSFSVDGDGEHVVEFTYAVSGTGGQSRARVKNVSVGSEFTEGKFIIQFCAYGQQTQATIGYLDRDKVYNLPKCDAESPPGKKFAGWRGTDGKRYDDGVLVFNLAEPGRMIVLSAIWE